MSDHAAESAKPPTTKLTATVKLYANSQDELSEAIRRLALNWEFHVRRRDEVNIIGGDRTIHIEHTNPAQTPEGYRAELDAWWNARKEADRG